MKRFKKMFFMMVSLLSVLILLLAGCSAPKGASESDSKKDSSGPMKIGLVTQLSGGGALYGNLMKQGAQLAVDQINAKGGVDGRKLKLLAEDDQANPSESVKVTQRMVSDENIDAWIGTLKSSDTITDIGITAKKNIPSFVPVAVADNVTDSGLNNVYRNVAKNSMQITEMVNYILKEQPHKKMAIIAENTDYGRNIVKIFSEQFEKDGRKITNKELYNVGQKDFNNQLTKIKASKPDSVLIAGLVAEGALIAKQAKQLGINQQLYSFGGFMGKQPMELGGSAVNNLIHTDYFVPTAKDEKTQSFVNDFNKKYGQIPDSYYSAATYDAVYLYADAVKKAGTSDPEKVNKVLHELKDEHTVMGDITFDKNGQAATKVWISQIQDGKQVGIYHAE
ncbi:ABC transporter substrate-binding protein [Terrilactibacillus laevilacticus]|uniref:ABC transporter substrate-binding protein n=1 Tax=Terrilactibacillus laevilacticus TaxID=1380157 RepID=A0ABW5PMX9_9BACI|nr:ABC transporter substrate-binding protein [Terrilactibacillus laevilacticus]